jgi:hypothetical protein
MNKMACIYPDRDAVLVSYLYDDIDPAGRVAFETHVATCLVCRSELAELRGVRGTLAQWAAPEAASGRPSPAAGHRPRAWWRDVPLWAQAAAAMLVVGVSAAVANLDVHYDRSHGLSVRTGWSAPAPAGPVDPAPWRADLATLETTLRGEMRAEAAAAPARAAISDADLDRRVRALLDDSERRQENELALRVAQLQRDVNAQRQADLTRINQNIGYIQSAYGSTYGDLRNYVLRASQRR